MPRRPTKRPAKIVSDAKAATAWLTSRWAVVLGLLVVLAIKLVALAQLADHPLLQPRGVLDDAVYVKLAQRVAAGDLALGPDVYFLSPFYTYFLGAIFGLGGSVFAARTVQCLLGVAAVFLIGDVARRSFGARAGWIAAATAALTGLFTFNEILLLQSSVDPFLSALGLWALARAFTVGQASSLSGFTVGQASGLSGPTGKMPLPTGKMPVLRTGGTPRLPTGKMPLPTGKMPLPTGKMPVLLAGVAFGLLVVNRPNALAAVVLVGLAWLLLRRSREAVLQVALLALGLALVIAPVTVRNRVVAGEWALITSHGGLNFYIGNHQGANGTWMSVPGVAPAIEGQRRDVVRVASEALGRPASAAEASDYFYGLGWKWIRENPLAAARLWARKLALTFSATDLALNYSFTYYARDESTILAALALGPWLLFPLGLTGLALGFARPQPPDTRTALAAWAAFVPGYAASLVVFFVASRYRLPLLVACCVGTGAAIDGAVALVKEARWRTLAAASALVAALSLVAWLPLESDTGRQFERGERIVELITAGQGDQADQLLAKTAAHYPHRALLLYRAGRAWQERGQAAKAISLFERALDTDPDAVDILSSAAEAYRAVGRGDAAMRAMEGIVRANDADPEDVLPFAADALGGGDVSGAERVAKLAAARWPNSSAAHDILGMALMLQDRRTEGEAALREAVRLDPSSATAHYHFAQAVAVAGRNAEAIQLLQETLRLKPDYPEARQLLARLK